MSRPTGGTRDGPFVVFKDWDMPGHDIAFYPNFRGQLDELKDVAMSNSGALITAFNTNGWMKACPAHDFSKWEFSPGSDTYVRVEYPGWHFIQGMDSPGNDLEGNPLGPGTNVAGIMVNVVVKLEEERSAQVAGFNTNGWVKTKILSSLTPMSDFLLDGLYVRTDFPGYESFQGRDSGGGDIMVGSRIQYDPNNVFKAPTWSGAIAGGKLADVGALVGPVGAIMGAIMGGIIGSLIGEEMTQLARWFFANGADPADLTVLMHWAARNLPK